MSKKLKVSTFQMKIEWENRKVNWENFLKATHQLDTDILVLPEMFLSGFSMEPSRVAIDTDDPLFEDLKAESARLDAAICGSLAVQKSGKFRNRMYFIQPNGTIDYYDKKHLFRMSGEDKEYTAGDTNVVVSYRGFRFCLQICYDLRFPVWSRNSREVSVMYDCLIYVANWPKVRSDAWVSLLKARAIENWSYCVGVNRVGKDGNGVEYDGRSAVFNFKGEQLDNHNINVESIDTVVMDKNTIEEYRQKFPAYLDADPFRIE